MVVQQDNLPEQVVGAAPGPAGKHEKRHRLKQRFEVIRKLGQGTYGKVQLAINKDTNQEVAIKTIKKSKIESEQDLVRIRREIQIMSSIQHPHIVHIYEVFENKDKIVLVMQNASGGELYDYLSEKKVLSDTEARRVFRQVATAIYYCHKNKICHRDLKLENILLDEKGNAKIADFGLSNVFDERHFLNTFCGSPLYASPEIVKGTPYYGPEVDCWSMGVLLYTLVYGAMPFDGSNFKRLVQQISEGDYYEPKKKSDASALIRRLLAVNPSKRATIIDICTDWWVNLGFDNSLLQVAEDMANLTPVRIDLLLALAPVSPPPEENGESKDNPLASAALVPDETQENILEAEEQAYAEEDEEDNRTAPGSFAYVPGEEQTQSSEFIPASLAVALEEPNTKRSLERSFDGSLVRMSSLSHKNKKVKISDSIRYSRGLLAGADIPEAEDLEENKEETKKEPTNIEERTEAVGCESPEPVEEKETVSKEQEQITVQQKTVPDTQTKLTEKQEMTSEKTPETVQQTSSKPLEPESPTLDKKGVDLPPVKDSQKVPITKDQTSEDSAPPIAKTTSGARRPGKITIPKFLDSSSPTSTPTPKSSEPKKHIIPTRSVLDARKAFESKQEKQPIKTTSKIADVRKAFEKPTVETKPPISKTSPKGDKSPPSTKTDCPKHEQATKEKGTPVAKEKTAEEQTTTPKSEAKLEVAMQPPQVALKTDQKEVTEEEKKAVAKGILKKTIAKAKLAEKKRASIDSEIISPLVEVTATQPKLTEVVKPIQPNEEESSKVVQSRAEITLTKVKKPEMVRSVSSAESETVWGVPLSVSETNSSGRERRCSVSSNDTWKEEVEGSLKRLSPEGSAEEKEPASAAPVTRSYKKFTFSKDGTCITESGKIYTNPDSDGTWTTVEKKTKVTKRPGSISEDEKSGSRLCHSDSQSSSDSNDIFEDMFDKWSGNSAFGHLRKMKSMLNKVSKGPFFKSAPFHDIWPDRERRVKDWRRGGNVSTSTDRDSSDNEEDFDLHFDDANPVLYGSQGLWQFMRSMNRDFKSHWKNFPFSSNLSRRSRGSLEHLPESFRRMSSREQIHSPRETMLRFVIDPSRQSRGNFTNEPSSPSVSEGCGPLHGGSDSPGIRRDSGIDNYDLWSRHGKTASINKLDSDRASLYGTLRNKGVKSKVAHPGHERGTSLDRNADLWNSCPGENHSGNVTIAEKPQSSKHRVEQWLHMSDDPSTDGNSVRPVYRRSFTENPSCSVQHPRTPSKYNRSKSEKLDLDYEDPADEAVSYRSEISMNDYANIKSETRTLPQPVFEIPVHKEPIHHVRQSSLNDASETRSRPVVRMQVSINNKNPNTHIVIQPTKHDTSEGLWQQCRDNSFPSRVEMNVYNDSPKGEDSLLEALKTKGYRNVLSQRLNSEEFPKQSQAQSEDAHFSRQSSNQQEDSMQPNSDKRGKHALLGSSAEYNACCMDTNTKPDALGNQSPFTAFMSDVGHTATLSDNQLCEDKSNSKTNSALENTQDKPKYQHSHEESVSERIHRKSFYSRFNDNPSSRARRRSSAIWDTECAGQGQGLWNLEADVPQKQPLEDWQGPRRSRSQYASAREPRSKSAVRAPTSSRSSFSLASQEELPGNSLGLIWSSGPDRSTASRHSFMEPLSPRRKSFHKSSSLLETVGSDYDSLEDLSRSKDFGEPHDVVKQTLRLCKSIQQSEF